MQLLLLSFIFCINYPFSLGLFHWSINVKLVPNHNKTQQSANRVHNSWDAMQHKNVLHCITRVAYTVCILLCLYKAWRPLEYGQEQETLPKWITPFRRTIRVRRRKSVRFTDSPDSTTNVCGLSADSPGNVLGFNREWCGMPRNVRIVARQCGHI